MLGDAGPSFSLELLHIFLVTLQALSPDCSLLGFASGLLQQETLTDEVILSFSGTESRFPSHLLESSRYPKYTPDACSIHMGHPTHLPPSPGKGMGANMILCGLRCYRNEILCLWCRSCGFCSIYEVTS